MFVSSYPTTAQAAGGTSYNAVIVGIGDSIMRGLGADQGPALSKLNFSGTVKIDNRGQDNRTIQEALDDVRANSGWGQAVQNYETGRTCIVLMQRATNDLGQKFRTANDTYADLEALVRLYKNQGFYVAVETCLPRTGYWTSAQETERLSYNTKVRANAFNADLIIDSAQDGTIGDGTALNGRAYIANGWDATTTDYVDGVHLSNAGQDRKAVIYKNALPTLMTKPPRSQGQFPPSDTTAPVITSATNISQPENAALTIPLTANETVTWKIVGGNDQAKFTLTGSNLTLPAKDFEAPDDSDANNTYIVRVRATDTSSNYSEVVITVTITDVANESATGAPATSRTTAMSYDTGKFGQARKTGTVLIPTSAVPATPTLPITLEIWAKTTGTAEQWLMLTDRSPGDNNTWGLLQSNKGLISLVSSNTFNQSKRTDTTFASNDGAWHHYRVRLLSSSVELDIDGTLVATQTGAPVMGAQIVLGEIYQNQYGVGWTGMFDEFAVFSGARTGAAPTAPYTGQEANLIALYHFDGDLTSGK